MEHISEQTSKTTNHSWLPGLAMLGIGLLFLINALTGGRFSGAVVPAVITGGIGLTFGTVYLLDRRRRWALVPAYIMLAIAGIILMSAFFSGGIIALFVMGVLAVPFIVIYRDDPSRRWPLFIAYALLAIGLTAFVDDLFYWGDAAAVLVPTFIGLPFFYLFLRDRARWWALVTAGLMFSIAAGALINQFAVVIAAGLIIAGMYLLFRQRRPSEPPAPAFEPIKTAQPDGTRQV